MKTIRALALAGVIGLSGCMGFTAGLKHATVGYEATEQEKKAPGYDVTVAVVNVLLTAAGYAIRHYQDKLAGKGADGLPK